MTERIWIVLLVLGVGVLGVACGESEETGDDDSDGDAGISECTEDSECDALQWCSRQNECVSACRYDLDCPVHTACDSQSRQCVNCTEDEHCTEEGAYCDSDYKVCKVGCENCAADQACVDGRCQRTEDDPNSDGDEEEAEVIVRCPPAPDGMACEPNCHECLNDETARQCREDGSGFNLIPCTGGLFCDDSQGACSSLLCQPGTRSCIENTLRICNQDGTDFEDVPCGEYEECQTNACINRVCSGDDVQLFTLNYASELASPDAGCDFAVNVGSASFEGQDTDNGVATLEGTGHLLRLDGRAYNGTSDLTVGLRFQLSGTPVHEEVLITKGMPVVFELAITTEGKLEGRLTIGGQLRVIPSEQVVSRGERHAAMLTYNGNEMVLYLDGEIQNQAVAIQGSLSQSPRPIFLGGALTEDAETEREMMGELDNILLAAEALGAKECAYLLNDDGPCETPHSGGPQCPNLCIHERLTHDVDTDWTQGEVSLSAYDTVVLNPGGCAPSLSGDACLGPEGKTNEPCQSCAMSGQPRYALLAKVSATGSMFLLPNRQIFTPTTTGNLFLGYNNSQFQDRDGALHTVVERGYCPDAPCPLDMVAVPGYQACIDRYEASCAQATSINSSCDNSTDSSALNRAGYIPWTDLTPLSARTACEGAGKRLCSPDEWSAACKGDSLSLYPYGDSFALGVCNEANHQASHAYGLEPTALLGHCVSDVGGLDFSGNAAEMVYDPDAATYGAMGGTNAQNGVDVSCSAQQTFISTDQAVMIGFRCCKDWP